MITKATKIPLALMAAGLLGFGAVYAPPSAASGFGDMFSPGKWFGGNRGGDRHPVAVAGGVARAKALDRSRNWEPTDEGHLLGEAIVAVDRIKREIGGIPGFSPMMAHQICHIILAQDRTTTPLTLRGWPGSPIGATRPADGADDGAS